uniref:Uncharacterized protein n=1 Tax=Globodera rostochiensis TaxID=31243 RepID=A0A914IAK6_GLORO
MNSFYWAKTAFVSLLMISSITFEATCSGPVSELFNSLIVGITSANEGEHSAASISNQRPLELKLADAQMLQQWIGQIARKFVVEDGIFAGNYLCCPNININDVILTDGLPQERIKNLLREVQNLEEKSQFLKLLFSFGAMLSAEIGEQSQQNGTIRALLKAYECVVEQFPEEKNGISDFVIGAVIKRPIEQLKVDKIILKKNNRRHIQEFALLNASKIEMTPTDVINFAYFISIKFLNHFLPLFEFRMANLGDLSKPRRIAHQFLLHLKNWGPEALEEISLEDSDEDVIKLTQREKCIFGIFARNLLRRIAKFELLEDYFGELNISRLVNFVKIELKFYERLSAENCNEKSFPFFDEAIRIDWNVWTEIIQQIDELTKTVKKIVKIPRKSAKKEDDLEEFLEVNLEAQLFELLFSFAARLEAIVHGKNIDGTIEESRENPKDKIRAFLAVPNCFNVPEWANKFSIFDYWMEIKEINSKESQKMPVIGVAIYKELFNEARSRLQKNYKMLKSLNEQKFSIYDGCEYAKLFQNISANFMKVEGVKWHMDKLDSDIQADVAMEDFGKYCKIIERNGRKIEETKISLLNNVRYDLVINFKLNAWKDVHDRTEDLLEWNRLRCQVQAHGLASHGVSSHSLSVSSDAENILSPKIERFAESFIID